MPRLELRTGAGVTAPCWGFGVLGMGGCELGLRRDAPMAANQQPGMAAPGRYAAGE